MKKDKAYKQFKGILNSREYLEGIKLCLQNASSLLEEAEILMNHKKFSRAYFLATTSLEEIAKVQILLGLMLLPNSQQEARDETWKDFYSHSRKYKTIAVGLVNLNRLVDRNFDHKKVTEPLARSEFNRMASLYVEYSSAFKEWRYPDKFVTPEAVEDVVQGIKSIKGNFERWVEIINPDMFDVMKKYIEKLIKSIEIEEGENIFVAIQRRYSNLARDLSGELFVELFQKGLISNESIEKFNKEMDEFNKIIEDSSKGEQI